MRRKMFVFDMDGTLMNSANKLPTATVKAFASLKKDQHLIVIATGRPYGDALPDLAPIIEHIDYIICNNGAYFVNVETDVFTHRAKLDFSLIEKVLLKAKGHKSLITLHGNKEAMRSKIDDFEIDWTIEGFEDFAKFKDHVYSEKETLAWAKKQNIVQVSFTNTNQKAKEIRQLFSDFKDQVNVNIVSNFFVDINPLGVNKLQAVQELLSLVGLTIKDVIAFGDSTNDLDLLMAAHKGFCMQNGHQEAKKVASEVIGSHNSNAIADKIKELVGKGWDDWS